MGVLGKDRAGSFEENFNIGKLGLEAREDTGDVSFVGGEIIVAASVVVVQSTNLAEFELLMFVLRLLLRLLLVHGG